MYIIDLVMYLSNLPQVSRCLLRKRRTNILSILVCLMISASKKSYRIVSLKTNDSSSSNLNPRKVSKVFCYFIARKCVYIPLLPRNSSDAVAFRSFNVVDCSWKHLVGDKSDKIYITDKEVSQVFDQFFISHGAMNDICHAISTKLTSFYSEANQSSQEDNQQFHRMIMKTQNKTKEATQAVRK